MVLVKELVNQEVERYNKKFIDTEYKIAERENIEALLPLYYFSGIYDTVVNNNMSFLGLIVGKHRAGKSLAGITLGILWDKTFLKNLENRVVYTADQFMKAINKIEERGIHGAVIVWDEAGVGLPSREWYDISNKAVNYALQVVGYLNPFILFITQDTSFIDTQAKKLLTSFYEMMRPNNNFSIMKPFDVFINQKQQKIYYKYPRLMVYSQLYILRQIRLSPLPDNIIQRYLEHSKPWKAKIMKQMEERTKKMEVEEARQVASPEKIKEYLIKNWKLYQTARSRPDDPKLDADIIAYEFRIPFRLAKKIKREVEIALKEMVEYGND